MGLGLGLGGDGSLDEMVRIDWMSRVPSEADRLLSCWVGAGVGVVVGVGCESLLMLARRGTGLDGD